MTSQKRTMTPAPGTSRSQSRRRTSFLGLSAMTRNATNDAIHTSTAGRMIMHCNLKKRRSFCFWLRFAGGCGLLGAAGLTDASPSSGGAVA